MMTNVATLHPKAEEAYVETVVDNLVKYSTREVFAKMGRPSVEMGMLRDGTDFDIREYDFKVADAMWGKDIASLKGKSTKRVTMTPDFILGVPVVQLQQVKL